MKDELQSTAGSAEFVSEGFLKIINVDVKIRENILQETKVGRRKNQLGSVMVLTETRLLSVEERN